MDRGEEAFREVENVYLGISIKDFVRDFTADDKGQRDYRHAYQLTTCKCSSAAFTDNSEYRRHLKNKTSCLTRALIDTAQWVQENIKDSSSITCLDCNRSFSKSAFGNKNNHNCLLEEAKEEAGVKNE